MKVGTLVIWKALGPPDIVYVCVYMRVCICVCASVCKDEVQLGLSCCIQNPCSARFLSINK